MKIVNQKSLLPSSFLLGGIKYKVTKSELIEGGKVEGMLSRVLASIVIATKTSSKENTAIVNVPIQSMEVTFYHELVHAILYSMGINPDDTIDVDEQFVEGFSQYLYQFLKTANI